MGKHASSEAFASYLRPLEQGMPVGVISEAGCPAVADPGADVVAIAQRKGTAGHTFSGSVFRMILAVMASDFNGQSFAFNGYLPIDPAERAKRIKMLEQQVYSEHQTQLFIETPYRNAKMFEEVLRACRPQTRLCVAAGITWQGRVYQDSHGAGMEEVPLFRICPKCRLYFWFTSEGRLISPLLFLLL